MSIIFYWQNFMSEFSDYIDTHRPVTAVPEQFSHPEVPIDWHTTCEMADAIIPAIEAYRRSFQAADRAPALEVTAGREMSSTIARSGSLAVAAHAVCGATQNAFGKFSALLGR